MSIEQQASSLNSEQTILLASQIVTMLPNGIM